MRRRRGLALLGGAVALFVVCEVLDRGLSWVPLLLGLAYLASAFAGGRRGGLWGPAAVLTAWGASVVALDEGVIDLATAPTYLTAAGVGVVVAGLLEARGFEVGVLGTGVAVVSAGLVFLLATEGYDALTDPWVYAAGLALWGATELARRT